MVYPDDTDPVAREIIKLDYAELGSWRAVGRRYGMRGGLAHMIATGKRRASRAVLDRLGICYVTTAPAPVCPRHGVVHLGRCRQTKPEYDEWRRQPRVQRALARILEWAEQQC